MTRLPSLVLAALPAVLLACGAEPREEEATPRPEGEAVGPPAPQRVALYERNLVFVGSEGDSTLVVPWFITAASGEQGVARRVRGWLGRGSSWDAFFDDSWSTPPTRVPWRILPRGPFRLVVGLEDAVDRVIYEEGPRHLELIVGATVVEWAGQGGESFQVHEGSVTIADRVLQGALLDMTRARRGESEPPGDWLFLVSGDSLFVVIEAPGGRPGEAPSRAWVRRGSDDLQWPVVRVEWTDVRAFERARRDVPVAWRIESSDGELTGELQAVTSHLEALEGDGPLLPVDGLFLVQGTVRVAESEITGAGLLRHLQR